MKKSILVILLVLLAFSLWSVLAIAKDKAAQKPTQVQKTEPNVAPDAFPKVMLPQAQPVLPTMEDFKREVLDRKSWTPETVNNQQVQPLPAANQEAAEKEGMPTLCTIGNALAGGYYHSAAGGNPYFYCWGEELWATFLNPEDSLFGNPRCAYPIYPFMAKSVMFAIYSLTDTAHVLLQPEIRDVVYDANGCAYPGAALLTGPVYNLALGAGGVSSVYLSLVDSICLYKPWFAVMHFINSDDFQDTVYCTPINTSSWFSELFDNSGRTCQSYWNPFGPGGSWYDVTLYGISSGAVRVRTRGYSKPENPCPIDTTWYAKPSFSDTLNAYAPSGVPDFYQYQHGFPVGRNGFAGEAYCGPTAAANCIWWLAADAYNRDPSTLFKPSWGGWKPQFPPILIQEIAVAAKTDPVYGTNCDTLQKAILDVIKNHGGWWFTETTVYKPDFWYIQKELRKCEDVILLLGFYQTTDGVNFWRFGGHFVTLAEVEYVNSYLFAFSDPALGNKENGTGPGFVGAGVFIPHLPTPPRHENLPISDPPFTPQGVHNDAGNVSHDAYQAAWPSRSPGGYLWLPGYVVRDSAGNPAWKLFEGLNAGPVSNTGGYVQALDSVFVEIEQAIVVSPGPKFMSGEVDGSHVYAVENNHGGVDAFGALFGTTWKSGLYKGTLVVGDNQADLNADYGDYYPTMTFSPLGPPVLDSFVVAGSAGNYTYYQLTLNFAHSFIPGLTIEEYVFAYWVPGTAEQEPEYVVKEVKNIHNDTDNPIKVRVAKWKDWDISGSGSTDDGDFNQPYQSVWMWNADTVFGETEVPHVVGQIPVTGYVLQQNARVYDGQYMDSLYEWMGTLGWGVDNPTIPADKSMLIAQEITIPPHSMAIKAFDEWGYLGVIGLHGDATWRTFLYVVLHFEGYYRGDANKDGKFNVADVIYMINYLFKSGPKPLDFVDQMDVDANHSSNVADVIYSINYLFKGGPAPIDEMRDLQYSPYVSLLHKAQAKRVPGLFGDANWKGLHP